MITRNRWYVYHSQSWVVYGSVFSHIGSCNTWLFSNSLDLFQGSVDGIIDTYEWL